MKSFPGLPVVAREMINCRPSFVPLTAGRAQGILGLLLEVEDEIWMLALKAVGVAMLGACATTYAGLQIYPAPADSLLEHRLQARIGEQTLPLFARRIWHPDTSGQYFMEIAYGRLAADGPVQAALTLTATALTTNSSPEQVFGQAVAHTIWRDIPAKRSGAALNIELPGPGQYYLSLPSLALSNSTFTVAIWVDDLHHLDKTRKRFTKSAIDVTSHGIRPNAAADQTRQIQTLLDQRGTICFPTGVYRTGTLRVGSDTTVWLAPGAVLRASDKENAVSSEFILVTHAHNVKLCGPGAIDSNSLSLRRQHSVHNVNITSSQDVTIEDLLFEESNSWALHISRSERFTARNVKVLSGKDGFDPDASRDVLIDGAYVMSADDAIAVKNRYPDESDGKTTERITFRNSIVSSIKSALKIGTETRGPIRDVTFANCEVFEGERGLVLYARDGGPIERVAWRNIRLFMRDWPQEKSSGAVLDFNIEKRAAPTPVRDCLVENVSANWLYRSVFSGIPEAPLDGITLRNITVKAEQPKTGKPYLFDAGPNVHLSITGLNIDWQGHQATWAGIASGNGLSVSK